MCNSLSYFHLSPSCSNPVIDIPRIYHIEKAPKSMQTIWQNASVYFVDRANVKEYDNKPFSKWRQLKKLWSPGISNGDHYEKKESVVITNEKTDLEDLKQCRRDLIAFSVHHLAKLEMKYGLSPHTLTMEKAENPTHTLRLLHYLDDSSATAHSDTSIMTCLYYQDSGLELKINGQWIQAPVLKQDQMLVMYGVPGEIISNGCLKSLRHRVKCKERYAIAYFHNTPKNHEMQSDRYNKTTMVKNLSRSSTLVCRC